MLKHLFIINYLILLTTDLVYPQVNKSVDESVYRFVYSINAMNVNSVEEAYAVSKVLADHIKIKYNRIEKTEVIICKDKDELFNQLKKGYEVIVLSTPEFLKYRKQFDLVPDLTNGIEGKVGFNYLLVVHKDDNISEIKQLQGSELNIQAQSSMNIPEMLINKLLKENNLPKIDLFFNKITKFHSTSNAVLPVFFKKAKAAIVTEQSLKVLREINPQIEKQLKVIYRSPSIILGLSCINEINMAPDKVKLIRDILANLHTDAYGKQLLNLFNTDKLVQCKEEYLNDYLNLFDK